MASISHELLVNGYLRMECKQYDVPTDICNLCLLWFIPIKTIKYKLMNGSLFTLFDYLLPIKTLHDGAYTVVIEVKHKQYDKKYAVKKYRETFSHIGDTKRILKEIKLMIHFNHPNIMCLLDTIPPKSDNKNTFNDIFIIMPKMDTNLEKVIRSKQKLSEKHIQFIIYQILNGLHYIHECGIVHTKIEPINILININNCHLKIIGFRKAVAMNTNINLNEYDDDIGCQYVVCRWYRSPEIVCGQKVFNDKLDIWGVGCIAAELYHRKPIFRGRNHIEQLQLIFHFMGTPTDMSWIKASDAKKWISSMPQKIPQGLNKILPDSSKLAQDFINELLTLNPNKRMDAEHAMSHIWLKKYKQLINNEYDHSLFDFSNLEHAEISEVRESIHDEIYKFYQIAPQQYRATFDVI